MVAVALTASVDLRRLQTPGGTALRWVQAAVFGECDDYLAFSVPDPAVPEDRARDQLCQDLRKATEQARTDNLRIGLRLGPVVRSGRSAEAQVVVTRSGRSTTVALHLARRDGRWKVVRDAFTCQSVGCA